MDFQVGSLNIYSIFQALPCFHLILFTCGTSCLYAEQISLKILQFQVLFNVLFLLLKPSWVCSLHDKPIIRRKGVEARNSNFIWEAGSIGLTKGSTPLRCEGGLTPKEKPQPILASSFYFVSSP